jgi:pilus assembly protein CpaC
MMSHATRDNYSGKTSLRRMIVLTVLAASLTLGGPLGGIASAAPARTDVSAIAQSGGAEIGQAMGLTIGKSTLLQLPATIDRVSVGNPNIADVTLISGRELYLLGKTVGTTNIMLWRRGGSTLIIDVTVSIDATHLQSQIGELLPTEKDIKVSSAADSVILTGEVSSAVKADQAVLIADAFARSLNRGLKLPVVAGDAQAAPGTTLSVGEARNSGPGSASASSRVVNMLRVTAPQQVMLEVKVAEVSKTLLDKLGSEFGMSRTNGSWTYSIISSLLSGGGGVLSAIKSPSKFLQIDAEKQDGLVKILAEPNIIAVSGQEGSFLAGGKIFIPVARTNPINGLSTITLEEKEFGVGLKFTPTVLDGGSINLRVAPEVSELSQTGSPFTTLDGTTSILPSFTTRRAQTTVQLNDGQSFAIAGLIKSNVTESMKRLPILGEVPILGALFRSNEFQTEQTELMFIVTPRLVKPLPPNYALPGDTFVPPTRSEFFIEGKLEGDPTNAPAATAAAAAPLQSPPAKGGFENQ